LGDGSLIGFGIESGCENLEKEYRRGETIPHIEENNSEALKNFLVKHGQELLPMAELIEQSQVVAAEMIDVLRRAMIEVVLRLSAEQIAEPPHPAKKANAMGGK
jgi:hypothetical protein